MLKRVLFFGYGVAAYLVFLGTFLYAVGFIGNFAVPTRLDGPARGPLGVGGVVWSVENPAGRLALRALFAFGWGLVLVCTFLINHFDLFGLRQVWLALRDEPYAPVRFATPGPYGLVRHPLYVGWFFAFWMTPTMTLAHLVFAIATTTYILVAIQFEEHDLVREHGAAYEDYRRRVPMLVPFARRRHAEVSSGRDLVADQR